jgi:hypothetical protein
MLMGEIDPEKQGEVQAVPAPHPVFQRSDE